MDEDLDYLIHPTSSNVDKSNVSTYPQPFLGIRHVQVMFYFLLMTYTYCMRTVLSLAIVAMNDRSVTINPNVETYNWTNQSVILSAFYWGYVVLQIPIAQSAKKFGVKWILVVCVLVDSGSCMAIPTMANIFGSGGVMACRVLQGLAQGGIAPLTHTLLGCWAPPSERSVLGTITYAGSIFGFILSLPLTGLICSSWIGWPAAFYLFGALGLKWVVLWLLFGANKPSEHKTITTAEKDYIQHSLGYDEHMVYKTPWKKILTSPPFWAVTLAFVGANWNSSVISTETPTYLYKILEFDIKSNSLLSAAPYVAMGLCSVIFSPTCDWLINKNIVRRGHARKIFNSIGTLLPAICLSLLGFIPKGHAKWSLAILIFNGGVTAGGFCGFQVNHVDLSPNHSGILMGITNSWTSVFAIMSPLIVQFIVTEQTNQTQWRTIFLISACVNLFTDLFFIIFASGDIQDWNELASSRTD
ncbi:putative inorganic phosphate cotransporter isoform X1 [Diorhabda carinulata]|uniref:putative inorganic phosphate cotransporter isoform X1 n=2 Tax=Diorhabda carinulata TaxID=1163345 RepID=UPI0025A28419|nr:putative inorganic phosphate cotransporter isoform X1 [Diorhabda carinulata]